MDPASAADALRSSTRPCICKARDIGKTLWDSLMQFTDEFNLTRLRLDVTIPSVHEDYHAAWIRPIVRRSLAAMANRNSRCAAASSRWGSWSLPECTMAFPLAARSPNSWMPCATSSCGSRKRFPHDTQTAAGARRPMPHPAGGRTKQARVPAPFLSRRSIDFRDVRIPDASDFCTSAGCRV